MEDACVTLSLERREAKSIRMTTMRMMRSFLCLLSLVTAALAECGSRTCIHGTCVDDECKCEPNFSAADCSIPFETCEDAQRDCYNGSQCVRNNERDKETGKYKYHCDCTKSFGMSSFAGLQCEQAATSYCIEGRSSSFPSEYAFCTNGGTCKRMVEHGSPHPGCNCEGDFEGMHCQYRLGEAPEVDLGQPYQSVLGEESDLGGVAVFFIVTILIGFVLAMGFVIYRKRASGNHKEEQNIEEMTADQLDDDQMPTVEIT